MIQRFLLVVRGSRDAPEWDADDLTRSTDLELALETPRYILLVGPGTRFHLLGDAGFVVGSLFHRHGPFRPIDAIDDADAEQVRSTDGGKLLADFWGGYVALVEGANAPRLLRDPSGALPCYLARHAGLLFAASHVDLLRATGHVATAIDWASLAVHLYDAGLPRPQTVLAGIEELMPAFRVAAAGSCAEQRPCWSPWDHVGAEAGSDPAESALRLRRIVAQCVQGWASTCDSLVLSISGGLDSSIVAACLTGPGAPEVHCLTMFGDDAGGDERLYGRALCTSLGRPLSECHYRVEDVDIEAPLAAQLPRPFGRTQAYAYEQAHLAVARRIGADAFMTGNGGDNVFGYSQSAAAIADRFMSEGAGVGVLATLRDVCRQTGCGMLEAGLSARRIARSPPSYRWRPTESLLHPDVLESMRGIPLTHRWLEAPAGTLPGKAGHIAALLRVLPNLHPGRSQYAPVFNPLVSQPVMEACLAIPSWQWRTGGVDRAVARVAFRQDLPELIVRRRGKGGPDGFTAQLLAHYRVAIRERLLDGRLAARRIIDRDAVERLLADDRPVIGEERPRLLSFLATEAWLDFWTARLGTVNAAGETPRA
jgi:asparagine synthase (glutamine-hydrolysing)